MPLFVICILVHSVIGAKYVDAGLPLLKPVVGKPRQRINARQSNSSFVIPELLRSILVPSRKGFRVGTLTFGLIDPLFSVGVDDGEDSRKESSRRDGGSCDVKEVDIPCGADEWVNPVDVSAFEAREPHE